MIYSILIILIILVAIINLLKVTVALRYIVTTSKQKYRLLGNAYPPIYILIPAIREGDIISNTLNKLSDIVYSMENLQIIIVTSEKERVFPSSNNVSTRKIAEETIKLLNNKYNSPVFRLIHYPHTKGIKSDQLNYVLKLIEPEIKMPEKTYVGIYDADSSVPIKVLENLAENAYENSYPVAYQQPTSYFGNYDSLGFLARSFALFQTTYGLCHEIYTHIHQSELLQHNSSFLRKRMRYMVGHGMFLRADILSKLGGFPSPIEDTRIGQRLSYLDMDIKVIPMFDQVQTTPKSLKRIKQASVWVTGVSLFLKDYTAVKNIRQMPKGRVFWLSLHRFWRNIVWSIRGFALPVFCILIGYYINIWWGIACLMIYLYLPTIPLFFMFQNLKPLNLVRDKFRYIDLLSSIPLLPLEFILASIGPIIGFIKLHILKSIDEDFLFPKTER